jgi:YVTN family beta-propeller protein
MAYDQSNGFLYVTNGASDNISVIDSVTDTIVTSIQDSGFGGRTPTGIAYDQKNYNIYAAINGGFSYDVDVINGTSNTIVQTITAYPKPYYVMYDDLNDHIYLISQFNDLTIINGTTNTVIENLTGSEFLAPTTMALDESTGYIYVTNFDSGNVTVVNGASQQVVGWIPVGSQPNGVAYDPDNGFIYVANQNSSNVTVIDGVTDSVIGSIVVGSGPNGVGFDPANGNIYVSNSMSGTVSIISAPSLASVAVTPMNSSVVIDSSVTFKATPTCTGGSCPSGVIFSWNLTNPSMGTLGPATGNPITFTASNISGAVKLFANATLNGRTVQSSGVSIIITPSLTSISVTPATFTLYTGSTQIVVSHVTCTDGDACPAGATYSWTLTDSALGVINSSTTSSVAFTSGSKTGTVTLFVNATLNGVTKGTSVTIFVTSKGETGFLGLPGVYGYIVTGVIIAAVAAVAIAYFMRRGKGEPAETGSDTEETAATEESSEDNKEEGKAKDKAPPEQAKSGTIIESQDEK